jgi:hypothetical protein
MDCGWRFGFPFPFYEYGGFVTNEAVLWLGLLADIGFMLVFVVWSGVLVRYLASRLARMK